MAGNEFVRLVVLPETVLTLVAVDADISVALEEVF
jgi:hypothetical protein